MLLPRFEKSVPHAARTFSNLRGKVLHNEMGYQFDDKENECVRFVNVLQYVMVLRRAGFPDSEIELVIGPLFNCNYKYMDNLMNE